MVRDKHGEKSLTNCPPGKNDLTLGNYLIYSQSDQSRKIRNKVFKIPSLVPCLLPEFKFCPFELYFPPGCSVGKQGMRTVVRSSHHISAAALSSCERLLTLFPCSTVGSPPTGALHEVLGLFYQLKFFINFPSLSPFHGEQFFRNRLLQVGFPKG